MNDNPSETWLTAISKP